jgi:hypothetical protein
MVWLDSISAETLVAIGFAWVALSTALALGLGRVLGRTNAAAMREQLALQESDASRPDARYYDPWLTEQEPEGDEAGHGSRASSGTRFKAVELEGEFEQRKIRRVH